MSTDIDGWIEVWDEYAEAWRAVMVVNNTLVDQDYDVFGLLFGVRNYAGFEPVAPARGAPLDASRQVLATMPAEEDEYASGHTWITLAEIKAIDPNMSGATLEVYTFEPGPDGELVEMKHRSMEPKIKEDGAEWLEGDKLFRVRRTRAAVLYEDTGWDRLIRIMEILAEKYDDQRIRMVVWFD